MFDNSLEPSDRNNADISLNQVRDGLASLTHRVGEIEILLNRKVPLFRTRLIGPSASPSARRKPARGK